MKRKKIYLGLGLALAATAALGCGRDALDEPMSGRTQRGTPVAKRVPGCFPAESRDLFWQMDRVADGSGELQPLDFDANADGNVDDEERNAIRGRNTWLVWGGGNETFWGWLQEQGYGITDFLILLDSRDRDERFASTGLINQPGFTTSTTRRLGLYLDEAKDGSAILHPPGGYGSTYSTRRYERPTSCETEPFEPWTTAAQEGSGPFKDYVPETVRAWLPQDGLDPTVYGYPSGIFGLRLWLNPDFFAGTEDAARARQYWRERVENGGDRYYRDSAIAADPDLVRPFRVSMSCGFCHIGPHPLSPPADPNHPEWQNLSGIIGGQYWDAQPALGNLLTEKHFLHHFLKSQAPGTVDTSLISTDHINNTNVINAVFDVPARLERAGKKAPEKQSADNLLLRSIEDPDSTSDERHFPMVLFPGEDSIGVFAALARVYLNIGLFSEQWNRVDNPVIGFTPQRPFSIATSRSNSVFWNTNEQERVPYLAAFFTLGAKDENGEAKVPKSTAPMRLKDAGPKGRKELAGDDAEQRKLGRELFINHCAICHSSKQPDGLTLEFEREMNGGWTASPAPSDPNDLRYVLPASYRNWEAFKKSDAYAHYLGQLRAQVSEAAEGRYGGGIEEIDPFVDDNFLSNELRIPVTLVGTYSGRAMATNAMRGQVWDNFSSETFKDLPSVGKIDFYDPYLGQEHGEFGTNATYSDGREKGGPGYYRPASLISLWATAPYLHNNALGIYTHDPSVDGRLRAFHDGIAKLLTDAERKTDAAVTHPGDLRLTDSNAVAGDPGYIYRVPLDTEISFAPAFTRPLLAGVLNGYLGAFLGGIVLWILGAGLWLGLVVAFLIGARRGRARHVGMLALGLALAIGLALSVPLIRDLVSAFAPPLRLWIAAGALALLGIWLLLTSRAWVWPTRIVFLGLALASLYTGVLVNGVLNGRGSGISVGPIPRGTPVNLLMNIDPEKPGELLAAGVALTRALVEIHRDDLTGNDAYQVFRTTAAPALMAASKVPDFVLDRGHWFGEKLSVSEKEALIAYLKTL
ncbi:MAG: hypothetical protein WEF50_20010 [Myxococcota bacterium]